MCEFSTWPERRFKPGVAVLGGRNTGVLRVRRRRSGPEVVLNRYLPTRRTEAVFQG
jgi:hypothetical protein